MHVTANRAFGAAAVAACVWTLAEAQDASFVGRWAAREADRGVVVSLTFATSNTLVIPGTGPDGRVSALTLSMKNLQRVQRTATFTVDLPDDEGSVDFEFRLGPDDETASLRTLRVEGEPPDDDLPSWTLNRQRQR